MVLDPCRLPSYKTVMAHRCSVNIVYSMHELQMSFTILIGTSHNYKPHVEAIRMGEDNTKRLLEPKTSTCNPLFELLETIGR